ncbi:MAG: hypothetical protein ACRD2T_15765 [Thermoanaerobaculia bacterium]
MRLGNRDHERFWIALTVRIAFGFLFLFAALNIFFAELNPDLTLSGNAGENLKKFVAGQSAPYEASWINLKWRGAIDPATGAPAGQRELGMGLVRGFLYGMPFVFAVLSVLLLTGLLLRPALRAGAIFLVLMGLGKYITDFRSGSTITTLQDFLYAVFITLALFVLSKEPERMGLREER